jgi:ribonuclease G
MEVVEHKDEVFAEFERNLSRDRTKTHLIVISKLGLLEMTRKKVAEGLLQSLSEQCPRCGGLGLVPSIDTIAIYVERKIRLRCAAHEAEAFKLRVSEAVAAKLQVGSKPIIKRIEEETGKFVILMPDPYAEIDAFDVLEEGDLKDVT